jgi:hypothetical protein
LNQTALVIWDKCCSTYSKIFESVKNSKFGFKNTVLICLGSYEQILPILNNNPTEKDLLNSFLCKSLNWNLFISILLLKIKELQ